ncbi:MAG: DUF167 domain-containing protein [Planctomycetes bacterium]|nr:DUF167 domain-containing protein [Planctomycetota bacterium]
MVEIRKADGAVLLPVKVVPGASRTRVMGAVGRRLKVAVAAPPEKGKANQVLIAHLAKVLGLRRRELSVQQGQSSAQKVVRIEGASVDRVRSALGLQDG